MAKKCCVKCFNNEFIQAKIQSFEILGDCDFCDSKGIYVIDVTELGPWILDCVLKKYENAAYGVSNCSGDGGYQLPTLYISDILIDEEAILSDLVKDPFELVNYIMSRDSTQYVRKDPYGPVKLGSEIYDIWGNFSTLVKEKQRFTFLASFTDVLDGFYFEQGKPNDFLELLIYFLEGLLVRVFKIGTLIYRARIGDDNYKHKDLTSPPSIKTRNSRMSPIGIPFFYGSLDDPNTAIAELRPSVGEVVTVAKFKNIKPLRLIHLAEKISVNVNVFDENYSMDNERLFSFLYQFANDIAKPIRKQDSEIEYIPTQVFTEFIRFYFKDRIHGLTFKSSLNKGGINIVLFNGPEISLSKERAWLKYLGKNVFKVIETKVTPELISKKCNQ